MSPLERRNGASIGDARVRQLAPGIANGNSDCVKIARVRITEAGAAMLADAMAQNGRFSIVQLDTCIITFPVLLALRLPDTVKTIELHQNWPCAGASLATAGASPFPTALETLCIQFSTLGTAAQTAALFRDLPPSLTVLDLGKTKLTSKIMSTLAPHLPSSLRELILERCSLCADAVALLAPHLPHGLSQLNLLANKLGDAGVAVLAEHLPAALTELDLSYNGLTDASIHSLAGRFPPNLQRLDLHKMTMSIAGADLLFNSVPPSMAQISLLEVNGEGSTRTFVAACWARAIPKGIQLRTPWQNEFSSQGALSVSGFE
ncbi:hypothetical protein H9P43_006867 [Blastocladiella emersonii ATCC 22665]|nr:hypothetical protein H9P43_006867 [Blastocladiella emersonii ATCC 22665]